jgi:sugar transferase (PEP-CTERM/EpsH1 system associated)
MTTGLNEPPLIAHIVFRFDYGGLENGIVNLINGLPDGEFRHVIIALTLATSFQERLREGVEVYSLDKRPGKDPAVYWRLFRLLRRLRPVVVHTRNIGTFDCAVVAAVAGVPVRIHGEHGWDVFDRAGGSQKYLVLRRLLVRFVRAVVAVSDELASWLAGVVGVPRTKIRRICNGVDCERFQPGARAEVQLPENFAGDGVVVIGSVTRFAAIKDPMNLVEAFIRLRTDPGNTSLRLIMIGDGELRKPALERLEAAGVSAFAWLPGTRDDTASLLRAFDVFVLGSSREGISNTILEAMATGLPVVATATGGNNELVVPGVTGLLVPARSSQALAGAIGEYLGDAERRSRDGRRARNRILDEFSIARMLEQYGGLYRDLLAEAGR